jgi:hypothetical protein
MMRLAAMVSSTLLAGCGSPIHVERPAADTAAAEPVVRDSLAVAGPGGREVWFTLAREDRAADGTRCIDRAIEIRTGDRRVAVPLLYTEEVPRFVDDSTLEARLYRGCSVIALYRVNTRTGQPTPVRKPR